MCLILFTWAVLTGTQFGLLLLPQAVLGWTGVVAPARTELYAAPAGLRALGPVRPLGPVPARWRPNDVFNVHSKFSSFQL